MVTSCSSTLAVYVAGGCRRAGRVNVRDVLVVVAPRDSSRHRRRFEGGGVVAVEVAHRALGHRAQLWQRRRALVTRGPSRGRSRSPAAAMAPSWPATPDWKGAQWTRAETPKAMAGNSNIRPARTAMPKGMTDIRVSATASVTGYSGGTYTQAERKTIAAPHRGSPRTQTCGPTSLATSSETCRPAYGGDRVSAVPI